MSARECNDKIYKLLRELGVEIPIDEYKGLDLYRDEAINKLLK